ncbi:MAG: hypothetical protein PHQ12_04670 [Chthoniobacteraceae bacterium]|nr:hypothetical protein [Chthoniobacteraceae bacterium]
MKTYSVKYQLSETSVGRVHFSLSEAVTDLNKCMRVAHRSGDLQDITLVVNDDEEDIEDGPLDEDEMIEVRNLLCALNPL